jgi:uncharacterized ion transporter superfamily protein YfcC
MKKRSDKIVMLLLILLAFAVLSWIIPGGSFVDGAYQETAASRAGIFDFFLLIYSAFYYKIPDVFFILMVGGTYSVLAKTKMYRKLVDKTAEFIEGKEIWAILVYTLVTGVFASLTSNLMVIFALVPFVVTVMLKNGYSRLTAIAMAFGGMFIGFFGNTFGTYGLERFANHTGLEFGSIWGVKIVLFVITYALYNLFACLHIKNNDGNKDETEYDLFSTEELEEPKGKKSKVALWPIITVSVIVIVICVLGYINWETSFGVTVFNEFHTKFSQATMVKQVPILSSILGTHFTAFGTWIDLLTVAFLMFVGIVILALVEKISVENFIKLYSNGIKKIFKVAFIYGLAFTVLFAFTMYPWGVTIINTVLGNGKFNIFTVFIMGLLATIFIGDIDFIGEVLGTLFALLFVDYLAPAVLILHTGEALALLIAPTSFLLLTALTYLDIPYKEWMKYIWKFAVSITLASILFFVIVLYM